MKSLTFEQMENVSGGGWWGWVGVAAITVGAGGAALAWALAGYGVSIITIPAGCL